MNSHNDTLDPYRFSLLCELQNGTSSATNETCCQGRLFKYDENYNEDFVPVVKHTSIRAFLSSSASRGLHIQHLMLSCMGTSKYTWHSHHDLMRDPCLYTFVWSFSLPVNPRKSPDFERYSRSWSGGRNVYSTIGDYNCSQMCISSCLIRSHGKPWIVESRQW